MNFSEGAVLLDDQPLNQSVATFPSIKEGSTLRTEEGRAEVLLTPGVFLRLDKNSAIRMVSNELSNTKVEFQRGAAILDSTDGNSGNSVVLLYKAYQLRFPKPGVYRLDSSPGVLETYSGEAEIAGGGEAAKKIDDSHQFFFDIGMETNKYGEATADAFSEWARARSETITAANRAEQSASDPGDLNSNDPLNGIGAGLPLGSPGYGSLGSGSIGYGSSGYGSVGYGSLGYGSPAYGPLGWPVTIGGVYGFYGLYGWPYMGSFGYPIAVVYGYPSLYGRSWNNRYGNHRSAYPVVPTGSTVLHTSTLPPVLVGPHTTTPLIGHPATMPHTTVGIPRSPVTAHPMGVPHGFGGHPR
ncbi:MAG: hypothetical protein JOY54_20720 [Acidobacteriaceae bacterium]|nr:hypothetical protein [Acidobacteriaceae bacterium]